MSVIKECRKRYLKAELELFPKAVVATLGCKAKHRLRFLNTLPLNAFHPSPPGCNMKKAIPSWNALGLEFRQLMAK